MQRFETSTETGRKSFIMDELVLECELSKSYEMRSEIRKFVYASGVNPENDYGKFLGVIKSYINDIGFGPKFVSPLMVNVINKINVRPEKDHLIKHTTYVIKDETYVDNLFRFLHAVEYLIEHRRMRLL